MWSRDAYARVRENTPADQWFHISLRLHAADTILNRYLR